MVAFFILTLVKLNQKEKEKLSRTKIKSEESGRMHKFSLISSVIVVALGLSACQKNGDTQQDIVLIDAKTVAVQLPQNEVCTVDGCTQYDFQNIQTGIAWIDDYFLDRLKKMDPVAFEKAKNLEQNTDNQKLPSISQANIRFLGQNKNLATFVMHTYTYPAGAAHGMYHEEYVNFDLKNKKRITVQDLVQKESEAKLVQALYEYNQNWLLEKEIKAEDLKLSDNFYYGAQGIVFVYSLYDLASYADGMSELLLPYHAVEDLINPEYLPSLPQFPK